MAKLYMMLGYPGAGKTTTAEVVHELTGAVHLQSDRARLELFPQPTFSETEHQQLYDFLDHETERLLSEGHDVIYDANLNRYEHRKDKYDICARTGATAMLLWVKAPKDLAKERAQHESRKHLWPADETPEEMFDRIADVIEEPNEQEAYIEVDGTKVTPEHIQGLLQA